MTKRLGGKQPSTTRGQTKYLPDRRRHVGAFLHALARARRELKSFGKPCQVFATVHPTSSGDDAIYVHAENPNGTPFPCKHQGAVPVAYLLPLLVGKVDLARYEVFSLGSGKERFFLLSPRDA